MTSTKADTPLIKPRPSQELWELSDDCFFTLPERKSYLEELRSWYWRGAKDTEADAEINRIYGEVNNMLSLIYSPEQIILEGILEGEGDPGELPILRRITKCTRDNFFYRRIDVTSSQMALNALIDGNTFIRPLWKHGGVIWQETPSDHIGVMYEALPIDSEWQVFSTKTELTERQVETWWPDIYQKIKAKKAVARDEHRGNLEVILGGQGSTDAQIEVKTGLIYKAKSAKETFECREVWQFEHEHDQWRKATLVEGVLVKDALTGRNHHGYFQLCPMPVKNWIWGHSAIRLIKFIQETRNKILSDIDSASARLLDPPLIATGYNIGEDGLSEKADSLKIPGSAVVIEGQNINIKEWLPKLEIDVAYKQLDYRDLQTKFITGVNEVMQGQAQKNVRSQGYATMLAQFASTELKRIAHYVEAQLEEVFTFSGRIFQESDKTQYKDKESGRTFYLAQFPFDYRLEIYGHTGSPIATENNINLSMKLTEMGLMPPDVLVDLLPLPYKDRIKDFIKLKAQQQQQAQAQAAAQQQQEQQDKKLRAVK